MAMRKAVVPPLSLILAATLAGCLQAAIDANKRQLDEQQAVLVQLQQQVAALQVQHANSSYSTAPPGTCDPAVMKAATLKGGERMAAGEVTKALGYYQDAVAACPTSAEAQVNLANTYESIGDRAEAIAHYRLATASRSGADAASIDKAKAALGRLGASS